MRKSSWVAICLAVTALVVAIVLGVLYGKQLFKMSINFILDYQNKRSNAVTLFHNIVSIFGSTQFSVAFIGFIHVAIYRKMYTMVFMSYVLCNAYFNAIAKQVTQQSRPFSHNTNVEVLDWDCHITPGFPSGHAWMAVLLYEPVFSDIIGTKGWRKLCYVWILLTMTLQPVSRQYLGSHTGDQVLTALLFSCVAIILYKYLFMEQIFTLQKNALWGLHRVPIVVVSTIILILIQLPPLLLYRLNTTSRTMPDKQIQILAETCDKKGLSYYDIEYKAGIESAVVGIAFGFLYGLVIAGTHSFKSFFLVNQVGTVHNRLNYYLAGHWNFKGQCKNVVKYLLIYGLFGLLVLAAALLGPLIPSFYIRYIFRTILCVAFGICAVTFVPLLLMRWDIIDIEYTPHHLNGPMAINKEPGSYYI